MSDLATTVWYAIVDQSHKIVATPTDLVVKKTCTINQLKKSIMKKEKYHDVGPASLNVYKSSLMATDEVDDKFCEKVSALLRERTPLGAAKKIGDCNIGEEETLFIELPWLDVWYCFVDQSHKIVVPPKHLRVRGALTIDELKTTVVGKHGYHVEPALTNVYHSSLTTEDEHATTTNFAARVSDFMETSTPLTVSKTIAACHIGEMDILFVELPWVDVWYRFVNQEKNFEGRVAKVSAASVSELIRCIKDERSYVLRRVDAAQLVVWRYEPHFHVDTMPEFIKNINFNDDANATALQDDTKIRGLGLGNNDMLLVQLPESDYITRNTDSRLASYLKALTLEDHYNKRLAVFSDRKKWPSLSKGAPAVAFLKHQNQSPIFNGRPANKAAIPVGLYHNAFNTFQTRLNHPVTPNDPTYAKVTKLLGKMADIYVDETSRAFAIFPSMGELIGLPILQLPKPGVSSDGTITTPYGHLPAFLAIVEVKNEIGAGNSDPYHQAGLAYRQYWTDESYKAMLRFCHFPTFLISIAGPCIMISGAIFLDKFIIEPLTDPFWFGGAPHGRSWALKATQLFRALKDGIAELESYYGSLQPTKLLSVFPFITSFNEEELEYRSQPYPEKLVYEATLTDSGKEVIIKFASTYNEEAHQLLAREGYAPQLYHVSRELYGGMHMIVMDKVLGRRLEDGGRLSEPQYVELEGALRLLHHGDFVHGDVRPPNIIIVEAGPGIGVEVKYREAILVDFDDCGKAGVGMYAAELNTEIGWPEGVAPGASMQFEHDVAMLKKLRPLELMDS